MHSPRAATVSKARADLDQGAYCPLVYARFVHWVCRVKVNSPSAMPLADLGVSPVKVLWWQQSLDCYNKIAANPPDSLYHTMLLDNQHDAFQRKVRNFSRSVFNPPD